MNCKRKPDVNGSKFKVYIFRYMYDNEISITDLAEKIGIPGSSLNHYANGGLPNVVVGIKIASFFDKKVEDLW